MANKNNDDESIESYPMDDYHKPLPNISLDRITEILGFESFNEKSKCIFDELVVEAAERRSKAKEEKKCTSTCSSAAVRDFPPILSSLNDNGRPRFNLEKVREDGRLQISRVKNTRPEVMVERIPPGEESDGRVRIKFIDGEKDDSSSSSSSSSSPKEKKINLENGSYSEYLC